MNWNQVEVNDVIQYVDPEYPKYQMIGHVTEVENEKIHIKDVWEDKELNELGEIWVLSIGKNQKRWFDLIRVLDNTKEITPEDIQKNYPEFTL